MAGIGFELNRLLRKRTVTGMVQAYAYAGIIGSGPWILSIVAIFLVGFLHGFDGTETAYVSKFQVSVTYLMVFSLLLASVIQLTFTRYAADRMYEGNDRMILPNLFGAIGVTVVVAGTASAAVMLTWSDVSLWYRLCMMTGFVILSCIWIAVIFASAVKAYVQVVLVFVIGYGFTTGAAMMLRGYGYEGLLAGFVAGQALILFLLLALAILHYPADRLVSLEFLAGSRIYPSLVITGVFYTAGIWIDKFIFWTDPFTGSEVIGSLRASVIYDLPVSVAYLSIVPGMAVFLLKVETDLSASCERFFKLTAQGTLDEIYEARERLTASVRNGFAAMIKVQSFATIAFFIMGKDLLVWFGISPLYQTLLGVNLAAVSIQLLLMAVLNVLFYLDKRKSTVFLAVFFFCANALLSWLSLQLGPLFYGYGFAAAVFLTTAIGLFILSRQLDRLVIDTFMYQRPVC